MPSFEFADCPTKLPLTLSTPGDAQEGRLTVSVKCIVPRRTAGRISIEPQGDAKAEWFRIVGAPATAPREVELVFEPNAATSTTIEVRVPAGTKPQSANFRLRVVSEQATDVDFVIGPVVSFDIQPWAAPPKPAPKVPWWVFAVLAGVVVMMIAAAGWTLLPSGPGNPSEFVGLDAAKALDLAKTRHFANPAAVVGPRTRAAAGTVTSVAVASNGDLTLFVEPGVRIISPPAAVSAAPGTIDLFGVGEDRQIYRKHFDGTTWTPAVDWAPLGGWAISALSATAANGTIDVVAIGHDKAIYRRAFMTNGDATASWMRIPNGAAILDPFVIRRGGELNVLVIGLNSGMFRMSGEPDLAGPWQNWGLNGEVFESAPTGASMGPGVLHVLALGTDRKLYIRWLDGASASGRWDTLGGTFSTPVSVTSWGTGRLDIVGIGMDGAVYWKDWNGVTWLPSIVDWFNLGGEFVDRPVIVSRAPGKLDIFAIGTNGQMYHKSGDSSGTWAPANPAWDNLGGSFVGTPTAVASGPDRVDVFALGADGTVFQKTLSGTASGTDTDWNRLDGLSSDR